MFSNLFHSADLMAVYEVRAEGLAPIEARSSFLVFCLFIKAPAEAYYTNPMQILHSRHTSKLVESNYFWNNLLKGFILYNKMDERRIISQWDDGAPLHYGFCPLVKLTFKDLAKLTAFAAIFKTKSYFR